MNNVKNKKDTGTEIVNFFEKSLIEIFEERKYVFADYIQKRLASALSLEINNIHQVKAKDNWDEIDSLSKLRAIVGGRFQNLKSKWLAAGFPLKQDKSTVNKRYNLNQQGWIELSSWISNQGFEVRLNPDKKNIIFEIKSTK